jgi:hypothetical protein
MDRSLRGTFRASSMFVAGFACCGMPVPDAAPIAFATGAAAAAAAPAPARRRKLRLFTWFIFRIFYCFCVLISKYKN